MVKSKRDSLGKPQLNNEKAEVKAAHELAPLTRTRKLDPILAGAIEQQVLLKELEDVIHQDLLDISPRAQMTDEIRSQLRSLKLWKGLEAAREEYFNKYYFQGEDFYFLLQSLHLLF